MKLCTHAPNDAAYAVPNAFLWNVYAYSRALYVFTYHCLVTLFPAVAISVMLLSATTIGQDGLLKYKPASAGFHMAGYVKSCKHITETVAVSSQPEP